MIYKIKVRFRGSRKASLDEILTDIERITGTSPEDIIPAADGATLLYSKTDDLQKIFNSATESALLEADLLFSTPKRFQAGRTVFVRNLSSWIAVRNTEDIIESINEQNPTLTATTVKLIRTAANTRPTLKLTLENADQATFAADNGFKCFGVTTASSQITKERYFQLKQCFKCFQYSHYTKKCTLQEGKCSICAGDHHYKNCQEQHQKCILCEGAHAAISPKCPQRQAEIKKMAAATPSTSTNQTSGSSNIRPSNNLNSQSAAFPALTGKTNAWFGPSSQAPHHPAADSIQVQILIAFANRIAGEDNSLFITTINKLLTANNIPTVTIPEDLLQMQTGKPQEIPSPATATTSESTPATETPQAILSQATSTHPATGTAIPPKKQLTRSSTTSTHPATGAVVPPRRRLARSSMMFGGSDVDYMNILPEEGESFVTPAIHVGGVRLPLFDTFSNKELDDKHKELVHSVERKTSAYTGPSEKIKHLELTKPLVLDVTAERPEIQLDCFHNEAVETVYYLGETISDSDSDTNSITTRSATLKKEVKKKKKKHDC